ncbi:hypothetical protein [Helicobacter sp. T3_23-1059]
MWIATRGISHARNDKPTPLTPSAKGGGTRESRLRKEWGIFAVIASSFCQNPLAMTSTPKPLRKMRRRGIHRLPRFCNF